MDYEFSPQKREISEKRFVSYFLKEVKLARYQFFKVTVSDQMPFLTSSEPILTKHSALILGIGLDSVKLFSDQSTELMELTQTYQKSNLTVNSPSEVISSLNLRLLVNFVVELTFTKNFEKFALCLESEQA